MIKSIAILLCACASPQFAYKFVQTPYNPERMDKWSDVGNNKVAYNVYYLGSACDMPILENLRASISNDTLYIDSDVPKHDNHDRIGESELGVDLIIDKSDVPNYHRLVVVKR